MPKKQLEPNAVCEVCGVHFRGRKGARFCGRKCFDIFRTKKVTVKCVNCGTEVQKHSRDAKWERHFCSMRCYSEYKSNAENGGWTIESREKARTAKLKPDGTTNRDNYQRHLGKRTHRKVAETMLGRPLRPGEVVHHINGKKHDNSPENLMVFKSQKEHADYHAAHPEESGVHLGKRVI